MSQKLYESYEWVVPFETSTVQGKKVIIRGKAIHATVSKNLRQYVREELIEFGRTLAGKYIDVNHEYSIWREHKRKYDAGETAIPPGPKPKLKGNVIDSQYNHLNGYVEYVAEVNHPEYAQKLIDRERMTEEAYRETWGKSPITCVSVDANFRFKRDLEKGLEPHGIIGNGLSLVEDPETPGVEGTSVEVFEIRETQRLDAQFKILQNLLNEKNVLTEVVEDKGERVLREREVKETESDEYKAIKRFRFTETEWKDLGSDVKLSYLQKLREQDEACPEGQHRNEDGECVPDEMTEQEECPEGQHRNEEGECVPNEATEQDECPEGQHRNEDGECVPDEEPIVEQDEEPCPEGEHRNEAGDCVPNDVTEQDEPCPEGQHRNEDGICVPDGEPLPASMEERKLPTLKTVELHLGEPFGDYTSFEDCVAKNSEQEDPEGYCADIQRKTEGETLKSKLDETRSHHRQQVQGKSIAHVARKLEAFEKKVNDIITPLIETVIQNRNAHNSLIKNSPCSANVKKQYQILRGHDTSIRAMNTSQYKLNKDIKANQSRIYAMNDSMKKMQTSIVASNEAIGTNFDKSLIEVKNAIEQLATTFVEEVKMLRGEMASLAKASDITEISGRVIRLEGDTRIEDLNTKIGELENKDDGVEEMRNLFQKYQDEKANTLTETKDAIQSDFDQFKARLDNIEERVKKPDFKAGTTQSPDDDSDGEPPTSSSRLDPAIG